MNRKKLRAPREYIDRMDRCAELIIDAAKKGRHVRSAAYDYACSIRMDLGMLRAKLGLSSPPDKAQEK